MSSRARSLSADDLGPVLLKVTVEVSDDHSEVIQVRERDDPRQLAQRFILTHGIADDLQEPLTLHIEQTLSKVVTQRSEKPQRTPSPRRPEEPRAKPPRSRSSHSVGVAKAVPTATATPLTARGATPRSRSEDRLAAARRPNSARKPAEPDKVDSVFTKLYAEALQLRQKREQAILREREQPSGRQTPLTPRSGSGPTAWTRSGKPGSHLYQHAQAQLKARDAKIQRAAEEKQRQEMSGVTFTPSIHRSQRKWPGASRARTPESNRRWAAKRATPAPEEDQTECLFQPKINDKSARLVALRLARLNISGPLHEHLYVDAQRRQLRVEEQSQELPKDATFQPQIGLLHFRPGDRTQRSFSERLAQPKPRRRDDPPGNTFRPKTGRGPTTERRQDGRVPIGEHLHEMGKAMQAVKRRIAEKENADRFSRERPKATPTSRAMMDEAKRKMYREVFLTLGGADGALRHGECGDVPHDHPLEAFVNGPAGIRQVLAEERCTMSYDAFCDRLDRVIGLQRVPSAHLFVGRIDATRSRTPDADRGRVDPSRKRSERLTQHLARSRRDPEEPVEDRLWREARDLELRLELQRDQRDQEELRHCTFQPNARPPPCSAKQLRQGVAPALDASRAAVERTRATMAKCEGR